MAANCRRADPDIDPGYIPQMARRCRERFSATKRCVREDLHPGKHLVVTDGEPVKWRGAS